jgi:hypothetical protein
MVPEPLCGDSLLSNSIPVGRQMGNLALGFSAVFRNTSLVLWTQFWHCHLAFPIRLFSFCLNYKQMAQQNGEILKLKSFKWHDKN